MSNNVYRDLQIYLDTMSMGFPPTASGIELRILQKLFSEKDARMFLSLTAELKTPEDIAARLNCDTAELAAHLQDMRDRGLLFSIKKGDVTKYGIISYMHGIYEFQLTRMDKEFAEMAGQYFDEAFSQAILASASSFARTIPVRESLDAKCTIAAFEDAAQIMRSQKTISVAECICRKEKSMVGKGCSKPREVCFMFGSMGAYYIENGLGRQVDADEAIRLLAEAQKAGLVTQPSTAQNPGGLCNCCGDCCGILRALNLTDKPAKQVTANYYAAVDKNSCVGCELCLDRCQVHALTMKENLAEINLDRCIGCGLCVIACPSASIRMVPKEKQAVLPLGTMEQMVQMAKARGL
ncbi:MAG: 4Fe-4S ferredoxin [Deltaproteobacteria bacterium HGW-Deltaproteobacteria-12]|nr:MAG: 4Fe-4S ferredoxin [Deltaproteobacteria bacterium HGW-Deltaproteobacteria-12]